MSRDWILFFDDLIEFCGRILSYTAGLTREEIEQTRIVYDATVRNVELIGECLAFRHFLRLYARHKLVYMGNAGTLFRLFA